MPLKHEDVGSSPTEPTNFATAYLAAWRKFFEENPSWVRPGTVDDAMKDLTDHLQSSYESTHPCCKNCDHAI